MTYHMTKDKSWRMSKEGKTFTWEKDIVSSYDLLKGMTEKCVSRNPTVRIPDIVNSTGKMGERGVTFKDSEHDWELTDMYVEGNWSMEFLVQAVSN